MSFNNISEIKIGMRVRCLCEDGERNYTERKGKIGTIINKIEVNSRIVIKWDDKFALATDWSKPTNFELYIPDDMT